MRRVDRTPMSLLAVGVVLTAIGLVVAVGEGSCAASTPPRPSITTPRVTPPPPRPVTPRYTPTTKTPSAPLTSPMWYAPIVFWGSC